MHGHNEANKRINAKICTAGNLRAFNLFVGIKAKRNRFMPTRTQRMKRREDKTRQDNGERERAHLMDAIALQIENGNSLKIDEQMLIGFVKRHMHIRLFTHLCKL